MEFDEYNPATWSDDLLPEGYEWRIVDESIGEMHLFAADGRNLSAQFWKLLKAIGQHP